MAKVPQSAHGSGSGTLSASTTYYITIANAGLGGWRTLESLAQTPYRTAGVLSNIALYMLTNDRGASTFRLRKNGANGNGVISIGASATGYFEDTSNTDTVAVADLLNFSLALGSGGTGTTTAGADAHFAATTGTAFRLAGGASEAVSAGATTYGHLAGTGGFSSTEANQAVEFGVAGTLVDMFFNVQTNTCTASTTVKSRINGTDGTLTVSVGTLTTGTFEDTTHSDTIAVGDTANFSASAGAGTGTVTFIMHSFEFRTTDATWLFITNGPAASAMNFGLTRYQPVGGRNDVANNTAEAAVALKSRVPFKATRLAVYISANTVNGSTTVTLRVASADAAVTLSVGSSTTGVFHDTTHSADVADGDLVALKYVSAGSSGSISTRWNSLAGFALRSYAYGEVY